MYRKLLPLTLLAILPFLAFKSEAFNNGSYTGRLNGRIIRLKLVNSFAGGSEIQMGNVTYYANSGHASADNHMMFQSKYIQNIEYFVLNNIQDTYTTFPDVITGKYYRGRRGVIVKFKLDKQ
ncbi:hypothetical protein [Mucilaginibacter sp. FT3.2]|uniref:hypothetical protein n=1 Tax=Mucilaginibacter sp. FT3.2 TaxID=2723090 RepID=UPI00161BF209|nr:hypothetical protein [Mucilaginibacter sp. FT3.2]MBB6229626.1 hypothetical protein [Mucilaginibacter sp. FT3.2]